MLYGESTSVNYEVVLYTEQKSLNRFTPIDKQSSATISLLFNIDCIVRSNQWSLNHSQHTNKTSSARGHSLKLKKTRCFTELRRHFFAERFVNNWNRLSEATVSAISVNGFKNRLMKDRVVKMLLAGLLKDWHVLDLVAYLEQQALVWPHQGELPGWIKTTSGGKRKSNLTWECCSIHINYHTEAQCSARHLGRPTHTSYRAQVWRHGCSSHLQIRAYYDYQQNQTGYRLQATCLLMTFISPRCDRISLIAEYYNRRSIFQSYFVDK